MSGKYFAAVIALLCVTAGGAVLLDATLLDTPSQSEKNKLTGILAPGLTATGLTHPSELTAAHERVLETDSYTIYGRTLQHYPNGTIRRHSVWTGQRSDSPIRYLYRQDYLVDQQQTRDQVLTQLSYYHRNNQTYQAFSGSTKTDYQVLNESDGETITKLLFRDDRLTLHFSVFNGTNGITISQLNTNTSHPYYRMRLTHLSYPKNLAVAKQVDSIQSAALTAVVDAWGVIHRYQLRYTGTKAGQTIHVRESIRVTAIGQTTIQQPS
jgi:hypothetical protein